MTEQAKAFCDALIADGLSMGAVFVPFSQSRNAKEKQPSLNWRITISKGRQTLTTDYMQGCAHLPHYSHAFSRNADYDQAVRDACETGRSRIRQHKNAYDACRGDSVFPSMHAKPIPAQALEDVLYCLVLDSSVLDHPNFESWASDCGYDTDSRKAEASYRAGLEHALTLNQMLDLNAAREAFQDY